MVPVASWVSAEAAPRWISLKVVILETLGWGRSLQLPAYDDGAMSALAGDPAVNRIRNLMGNTAPAFSCALELQTIAQLGP